ncbi:hypothetical protein AMELA_G00213400 [Ameiurus melas]|uniref:Uncharacterized protein n=1 Tax=Ameiurus melas TaxID=219545 RepID=A0A7J6A0E9_AMEME|nr:hypothetical protein AMELA_G00213400 [Ameiurus melas]
MAFPGLSAYECVFRDCIISCVQTLWQEVDGGVVCSKCETQIRGCSQKAHAHCWAGEGCTALILFRRKRRDGICEWCVSV